MTDPRHAVATESGRFYSIPQYENTTFRSVTNICGVLDKPALAPAASKRAGERAVFEEEKWHAIQQEEGDEEARKFISRAMRDYSDYACNMGSAVHFCCEHFDNHVAVVDGQAIFDSWLIAYLTEHWATKMSEYRDTVAKNIEQVRKHVNQYVRAMEECNITFIDRERTVCHPDLGYAGTLDGIVTIGDDQVSLKVLDIKTGGVYPESVCMQLAAYRYATHEVHGDHTTKRTAYISGGVVLQLKPASYKLLPVRCDMRVFDAFKHAMECWTWKNEDSKAAMGGEWV